MHLSRKNPQNTTYDNSIGANGEMGAHEHYHDQHGENVLNTLTEPDRIGLFMHRRGVFGLSGVLVWVGIEIVSKSKRRPDARPAFRAHVCMHKTYISLIVSFSYFHFITHKDRGMPSPIRNGTRLSPSAKGTYILSYTYMTIQHGSANSLVDLINE